MRKAEHFVTPVQFSFSRMRKAILLYNPLSGRRQHQRLQVIQHVTAVLRDAGVELTIAPTAGEKQSAAQAQEAAAQGCDTVLACGGDGTIHDILQGLVGTPTALGLIPLGTANALAHDLKIPMSPVGAARAALNGKERRIAVGKLQYQNFSGGQSSCYFIAAAGIGADAHLFHALDPAFKLRFGMLAYYTKATKLWLTLPLTRFAVEFAGSRGVEQAEVSELLAVRIRNFGGVLRELAPGASLERDDLRLVLFKTSSRWRYLQYVMRGALGSRRAIAGIEWAHTANASCRAFGNEPVYVEADGEILGTLPAGFQMVPDALTVLAPAASPGAI
jgi:diacylglycerol kinase (ATP)